MRVNETRDIAFKRRFFHHASPVHFDTSYAYYVASTRYYTTPFNASQARHYIPASSVGVPATREVTERALATGLAAIHGIYHIRGSPKPACTATLNLVGA